MILNSALSSHIINNEIRELSIMDVLKNETVEITFSFQRDLVKRRFLNRSPDVYYQNDANSGNVVPISDNKKLFEGSAKLSITPDCLYCLNLEIVGVIPENAVIENIKLTKTNCDSSEIELDISHDFKKKSWLSTKVFNLNHIHSTACSKIDLEMKLVMNLYLREPLNNYISDKIPNLFENGKYSDIIVSVNDKKFKAHKAILMERSPVFEAMFSSKETKESQKSVIEIEDFEEDVVKDLLTFIYSGVIVDPDQIPDLYLAADKYQIDDLRMICLNKLKNGVFLEKNSLIANFIVAEQLEDQKLKAMCFNFLKINRVQATLALNSITWTRLVKSYPMLATDIVNALIKNV